MSQGRDISDGRASDQNARRNTDAGSSSRCGKAFSSLSTFSADDLAMSLLPPCAIACINSSAHVKNLKYWQPYQCLDTRKYCTLIGMGSAALETAVDPNVPQGI